MKNRFYGKGELKDKKVIAALERAARQYENGEIAEVRDVLFEIIEAIDTFEAEMEA